MVWSNTNNNLAEKNDIIKHPYVIFGLGFVAIAIIVYVIYKYAVFNKPKQGYTYYSDDLRKMDNLFSETVQNIDECQKLCEEQPRCRGFTFDSEESTCMGQEYGRIRTDDDRYYGWVKPMSGKTIFNSKDKRLESGKLITPYLKSRTRATLGYGQIPLPPLPDQFSFSFWLVIQDWYFNFSYWRHIFHKGTPVDLSENKHFKTLLYYSWEKLSNDFPDQTIGAWLTPFQNNLRLGITTISKRPFRRTYPHAHIKRCDCDGSGKHCRCWTTDQSGDHLHAEDAMLDKKEFAHLEYVDIQDLPTNVPNHIVVSIKGSVMNIYLNGKQKETHILRGRPKWNNGDMYIHNPKSYQGLLQEFKYFPASLEYDLVKALYQQEVSSIATQ